MQIEITETSIFKDNIEYVRKEVPKEVVIPPGIVSFTNYDGNHLYHINPDWTYEQWVDQWLVQVPQPIQSIKAAAVIWEVGEKVLHAGTERTITKFTWETAAGGYWMVECDNNFSASFGYFTKLPKRTPVCKLPDENGKMVGVFKMDYVYSVREGKSVVQEYQLTNPLFDPERVSYDKFFATRAAALAHLAKTKKAVEYQNQYECSRSGEWRNSIAEANKNNLSTRIAMLERVMQDGKIISIRVMSESEYKTK